MARGEGEGGRRGRGWGEEVGDRVRSAACEEWQRQTWGTARGTLQKGSNDIEELTLPLELELKQRVQRSSCRNMPANVSANIHLYAVM